MSDESALPDGWQPPVPGFGSSLSSRLLTLARHGVRDRFLAALDSPEQAQHAALERVLDASRGTSFARRYRLGSVRTLADYRDAVPIRPSSEHEPWLRRAAAEGPGLLTRHPHLALNRTSGTTGRPKDIPVTAPWARAVSEAQTVWLLAMLAEQPQLAAFGARALTTVGRRVEARTATGVPIGSNTGRMHGAQPWWVKLRYAVPASIFDLPDVELRTYVMLRLALAVDVRSWTTANPSSLLLVCRLAEQYAEDLARDLHDGTLRHGPAADLDPGWRRRLRPWVWRRRDLPDDPRPGAFWPNLACVNCWKGGAAPFFLERLPRALGADVRVREVGVSASEGHLAVPLHSSWWGGVLHVGGHVLELLPEEDDQPVLPHQVEVGAVVRPILSTTAGLYRYDLGDRLIVEGFYRRTPVVRFLGKVADIISITGEKLTVDQLVTTAREVLHPDVVGWSVQPVIDEVPHLDLLVDGPFDPAHAAAFEEGLRTRNGEYASKRSSGRYGPVRIVGLPPGTLARWRASRSAEGAADGQIKDPCIVTPEVGARLRAGWPTEPGTR